MNRPRKKGKIWKKRNKEFKHQWKKDGKLLLRGIGV
jgi:hypothetical protein